MPGSPQSDVVYLAGDLAFANVFFFFLRLNVFVNILFRIKLTVKFDGPFFFNEKMIFFKKNEKSM